MSQFSTGSTRWLLFHILRVFVSLYVQLCFNSCGMSDLLDVIYECSAWFHHIMHFFSDWINILLCRSAKIYSYLLSVSATLTSCMVFNFICITIWIITYVRYSIYIYSPIFQLFHTVIQRLSVYNDFSK